MAQLKNTTINDSGFFKLPAGTSGQRPGSPTGRELRFNTETGKLEQFRPDVGEWIAPSNSRVIATGGDAVYDVDVEGTTYRVHVFTSTGTSTFEVLQGGEVEYLIVAGAGGGGQNAGAGGGGGGLLTGTNNVMPQNYTVSVGAGGAGGTTSSVNTLAENGQNSSVLGLTAIGGGAGTNSGGPGAAGGSGGGAGNYGDGNRTGGDGTPGQGNKGGDGTVPGGSARTGAGGGGAGRAGQNSVSSSQAGRGGIGLVSFLNGIPTFYAGGGGGAVHSGTDGIGGLGGGANGSSTVSIKTGTPNTGGGGGAGRSPTPGGAGGDGIVIIRYPLRQENPVTALGKAVSDGLVLDLDFAKPTVYSGSGSVVTDSRLNGIEGSINGPTFINPRTHRSAFEFNDPDEVIFPNINLGTNEFTVISWLNLTSHDSPNSTLPIHLNGGSPQAGFRIYQGSSTTLGCWVRTTSGTPAASADQSVPLNQISQLAVTLSGSTISFYLNGLPNGGDTIAGTPIDFNNVTGYIGVYFSGNYNFDGFLYSCKLYNRSFTIQDVQQEFNATRWRFGI